MMPKKVLSQTDAVALVRTAREAGRSIVFTNGVFDILHPGHVRYLQDAKAQDGVAAILIVGVNSDRSVRSIKGHSRPINPEAERAEIIAALSCVDAVVIFDEDTPKQVIELLQP